MITILITMERQPDGKADTRIQSNVPGYATAGILANALRMTIPQIRLKNESDENSPAKPNPRDVAEAMAEALDISLASLDVEPLKPKRLIELSPEIAVAIEAERISGEK